MRPSCATGIVNMAREDNAVSTRATQEFVKCNIRELPMTSTSAHDGVGEILFHRIATSASVSGACNFIDFTKMPPGTTIGRHTHREDEEEFYLIVAGTGTMQLGSETFFVRTGDLIRNPPGGTHALQNTGDEILELFVFEVKVL